MAPWVKALLYDKNDSNAPIPPATARLIRNHTAFRTVSLAAR